MIVETLQSTGNFLTLCRRHPALFQQPVSFELANGTLVSIAAPGIIVFEPRDFGDQDIVLSSGIHGNETAPIEICDEFVRRVLTQQMVLAHRVLFIFGNLASMDIDKRFVDENMNRLFPKVYLQGAGMHNVERQRAKVCDDAVADFFTGQPSPQRLRFHFDLHTAIRASKRNTFAVYPFLDGQPHCKRVLTVMADCGVNTILLSSAAATTFSFNSWARFGVHALTVELGKVKPFGENDMSEFEQARSTLQSLITGEYQFRAFDNSEFEFFSVSQTVTKHADDFVLHFDDDTPNFSTFDVGTIVSSDSVKTTRIEVPGEAIVFPNAKVRLTERAMLMVAPGHIVE